MTSTVLVVEDERKIRDMLRGYLQRDGYAVVSTDSGAEAIMLAEKVEPDLVLLDLRLPDVAGEEVAREIRTSAPTPIIMLTAKTSEDDRVKGLEIGADDYVTKPFSPRELMLRVRSVLRRAQVGSPTDDATRYGRGELVIDEARHEVSVRGETVDLTPTEWALLAALSAMPGRVYSRYELVNRVRGYEFEGYERVIDSHVKNLRRKIEADPHTPRIVETVLGAGYRLGLRRDT
jgi:DNA-binding response OmpR family regulator